jgi:Tat protein secretion system quality control protein TatD with DNase activity
MTNLIYNALLKKAEAEKAEAIAILSTYMKSSVGIGEHPQIIEEADKYLEKLAAADDKIGTLQQFFDKNGDLINYYG